MGVLEALIQQDTAERSGGMHWTDRLQDMVQRQTLKRLGQAYLQGNDFTEEGRARFMQENGVDENTMNAIQKITNIVKTGGVDLQGQVIGNKMYSTVSGGEMATGPEEYGYGANVGLYNKYSGDVTVPVSDTDTEKSFVAQWLKDNPNPSEADMLDFAKRLHEAQSTDTSGKDNVYLYSAKDASVVGPYTKAEASRQKLLNRGSLYDEAEASALRSRAIKEIPQIDSTIYDLETGQTDKWTQFLISMYPDRAKNLGMKIDEKSKEQVLNSLRNERAYLEVWLPDEMKDPMELGL